jgi:hypothetical protein
MTVMHCTNSHQINISFRLYIQEMSKIVDEQTYVNYYDWGNFFPH